MPEPADDELEQSADVVVRFADEYPCHARRIADRSQGLRDRDGMKHGMNARPRVLVVDDDDDIRLLLRELLERAGYTVDEAEDGRTALRSLFASAARARDPRRVDAGDGRLPDARAHPRSLRRAGAHADRPDAGAREGARPVGRRRRLRREAVRPAGAARPRPGAPAADRRQVGGDRGLRGRLRRRSTTRSGASSSRAATCS